MKHPRPGLMTLIRQFTPYFKGLESKLVFVFIVMALIAALPVLTALLPKLITSLLHTDQVDFVGYSLEGYRWLHLVLLGFVILNLVFFFLQIRQSKLMQTLGESFTNRIRLDVFERLGKMRGNQAVSISIGDMTQHVSNDVMTLRQLFTMDLAKLIIGLGQLVFSVIALIWLDWLFFLIAAVLFLPISRLIAWLNSKLNGFAMQHRQEQGKVMTTFIEGVTGNRDLLSGGRYEKVRDQLKTSLDKSAELSANLSIWGSLAGLLPSLFFTLLLMGYYYVSTGETVAQSADAMILVGEMLSFAMLINNIRMPVQEVSSFITRLSVSTPSIMKLVNYLNMPVVEEHAKPVNLNTYDIEFKDIAFGFNPEAPPIIRDLNMQVAQGQFIGIAGESGSGKSTLFNMLLRVFEPRAGQIFIGGHPIQTIPLEQLRTVVSYIPQHPFIFDGTIRENLLVGVPGGEVAPDILEEVLNKSHLNGLIEKRKKDGGLDAPVGASGNSLSGGEKQRMALARAMLAKPQILVCDEYTANVDSRTAAMIHHALRHDFEGCTRIVISHQLAALRGVDKIYVLEQGRVDNSGDMETLVEQNETFRMIWEAQHL